jgi:hypothetical protein
LRKSTAGAVHGTCQLGKLAFQRAFLERQQAGCGKFTSAALRERHNKARHMRDAS